MAEEFEFKDQSDEVQRLRSLIREKNAALDSACSHFKRLSHEAFSSERDREAKAFRDLSNLMRFAREKE